MATRFPKPIPRLRIQVPYRPRKLKDVNVKTGEGRLMVVKRYLNKLIKEERIELPRHHADETRLYAERLIQLAIEYGDRHKPTMELADYYLEEKDLIHKLFKVLVPRFHQCPLSYTKTYRLPAAYRKTTYTYRLYQLSVLELRGNPYPPVIPEPEIHSGSLLNILLTNARKHYHATSTVPPVLDNAEAETLAASATKTDDKILDEQLAAMSIEGSSDADHSSRA